MHKSGWTKRAASSDIPRADMIAIKKATLKVSSLMLIDAKGSNGEAISVCKTTGRIMMDRWQPEVGDPFLKKTARGDAGRAKLTLRQVAQLPRLPPACEEC